MQKCDSCGLNRVDYISSDGIVCRDCHQMAECVIRSSRPDSPLRYVQPHQVFIHNKTRYMKLRQTIKGNALDLSTYDIASIPIDTYVVSYQVG